MTANNPSVELLPCPHCGGGATVCVGYHGKTDAKVVCSDCTAEGPLFGADDYKTGRNYSADAIAAWNRRAQLPITDRIGGKSVGGEAEGWAVVDPWGVVEYVGSNRETIIEEAAGYADEYEDVWRMIEQSGYRCIRVRIVPVEEGDGR